MVIDGHLRVEMAMRQDIPTIPVQYVNLSDAEAKLALASFDPISAMAYADADQLRQLLDEVSTGDAAVMAMLSAVMVTTAVRGPASTDSSGTATSADPNPETDCAKAARTAIPKAPSATSITPDVGQRA